MLAFSKKTKIVMAYLSDKVSNYLNTSLKKELSFFEKKYKFKINILSDNNLIIPEYKIHLLNKNKKIIEKFENLKNIEIKTKNDKNLNEFSSDKNKKKKEKTGRILWVRKKIKKLN